MAWRRREPMGSLIMDDNQSHLTTTGQEEEIIEELVLNGLSVTRGVYRGGGSPSPPSSRPSLWEQHCDQNYMKCLNNLGKSQMLGGPEFPKPNICLYDSQIIQWLYCPPAWREIAQPKLGFFKNFYLLLCPSSGHEASTFSFEDRIMPWHTASRMHWSSPSRALSFLGSLHPLLASSLYLSEQTVEKEWSWVPQRIGPAGGFQEVGWLLHLDCSQSQHSLFTLAPLCFQHLSSITHSHSPTWASEEHLSFSSSSPFKQFNSTEQNGGYDSPRAVQIFLREELKV